MIRDFHVPIEKYYGRQNGDGHYTAEKGKFSFQCYLCHELIEGNLNMMAHALDHCDKKCTADNKLCKLRMIWRLTRCRFCPAKYQSPFDLQRHVFQEHRVWPDKMCHICEENCVSLDVHMKNKHSTPDMPYSCFCRYRSSVYSDVIAHFRKRHSDTKELMCFFCLEVFISTDYPTDGHQDNTHTTARQNIIAYERHVLAHVDTQKSETRCFRCCLQFSSKCRLNAHISNDHGLLIGTGVRTAAKTVVKINPMSLSVNILPRPTLKIPAVTGSSPVRALNVPAVVTAVDLSPVKFRAVDAYMRCIECHRLLTRAKHFISYRECPRCRYGTACGEAFQSHASVVHSAVNQSAASVVCMTLRSTRMTEPAYCSCGFHSPYGSVVANHLIECNKQTCFSAVRRETQNRRSVPAVNPARVVHKIIDDLMDLMFPAEAEATQFLSALLDKVDKTVQQKESRRKRKRTPQPVVVCDSDDDIPAELKGSKKWSTVKITDETKPSMTSIFLGADTDLPEMETTNIAASESAVDNAPSSSSSWGHADSMDTDISKPCDQLDNMINEVADTTDVADSNNELDAQSSDVYVQKDGELANENNSVVVDDVDIPDVEVSVTSETLADDSVVDERDLGDNTHVISAVNHDVGDDDDDYDVDIPDVEVSATAETLADVSMADECDLGDNRLGLCAVNRGVNDDDDDVDIPDVGVAATSETVAEKLTSEDRDLADNTHVITSVNSTVDDDDDDDNEFIITSQPGVDATTVSEQSDISAGNHKDDDVSAAEATTVAMTEELGHDEDGVEQSDHDLVGLECESSGNGAEKTSPFIDDDTAMTAEVCQSAECSQDAAAAADSAKLVESDAASLTPTELESDTCQVVDSISETCVMSYGVKSSECDVGMSVATSELPLTSTAEVDNPNSTSKLVDTDEQSLPLVQRTQHHPSSDSFQVSSEVDNGSEPCTMSCEMKSSDSNVGTSVTTSEQPASTEVTSPTSTEVSDRASLHRYTSSSTGDDYDKSLSRSPRDTSVERTRRAEQLSTRQLLERSTSSRSPASNSSVHRDDRHSRDHRKESSRWENQRSHDDRHERRDYDHRNYDRENYDRRGHRSFGDERYRYDDAYRSQFHDRHDNYNRHRYDDNRRYPRDHRDDRRHGDYHRYRSERR